jgi:hypothetical protein
MIDWHEFKHQATLWIIAFLLALAFRDCCYRLPPASGYDCAACPDDVRWFGIDHQTSQAAWMQALRERDRLWGERWLWESQGCLAEWEQEYADQYYRWQCWDAFDDALRLWPGCERRLTAIRNLRRLLGDDWYYRGIMPQPARVS